MERGAYRQTDPETSRQPFDREKLQAVALKAIASSGSEGITAGELGEITQADGIWKRLPELERLGKIKRGSPRLFSGTNRWQTTWHINDHQLSFLTASSYKK
tara:strand:- start:190 stop:495 length:306 start_codon:yes stop_codon:yes gene_type:complete